MKFKCPECSVTINAKEEIAGKKVKCPKCTKSIQLLPADSVSQTLPEPVTEQKSTEITNFSSKMKQITSIKSCISEEERKKRLGSNIINVFIWLCVPYIIIATFGFILLPAIIARLYAELSVKRLQVLGTTAGEMQFKGLYAAAEEICKKFSVTKMPRIIILNDAEVNAFALKFAHKRAVVITTAILKDIIDKPQELRFLLGHEIAHIALDHGARGIFEIYKPAPYQSARELTCDNCGCAAAGDLQAATDSLKRLCVGDKLIGQLDNSYLFSESKYLYSGFSGWLLKNRLTHPPLGKRIENVTNFFKTHNS